MKIGNGWTKDKDGKTFISIALDETFLKLFPQFKDYNLSLGYIDKEDRKSEKSPSWNVNLSLKKVKAEGEDKNNEPENEEIPY